MKLSIRVPALLAIAALLPTACSGSDDTPAEAAAPSTLTAGTEAAADPIVTYDGTECTYQGPTEFDLNNPGVFTIRNESDVLVGIGVGKVVDGVTMAEVAPLYETGDISGEDQATLFDDSVDGDAAQAQPGEAAAIFTRLTTPGTWFIWCFAEVADDTIVILPTSLFEVATA